MQENKKKTGVFPIEIVLSVILAGSVILCLTIACQVIMRGYATLGGYSLFRVVTGSMEPTIPTGALLICDNVDIESIKKGDIICFTSKDRYMNDSVITHRVHEVRKDSKGKINLYTKGDANVSLDGYTSDEENFIGKVTWYTKKGSTLMKIMGLLTSTYGFLTCVVFPLMVTCIIVLQGCTRSIMRDLQIANAELDAVIERNESFEFSEEEIQQMYARVKEELLQELGLSNNDGEV